MFWWSPTCNAQSLEQRSSSTDSCVSCGLVFWKGTERLVNWGHHPFTQKGRQEWMHWLPGHLFQPPWIGVSQALWKKMLQSNWSKAGRYPYYRVKIFGECCGSTVLTAACYWTSNHCILAQKFVFRIGGGKSQAFTIAVGCWAPARMCCVLSLSRPIDANSYTQVR